MSDRVPPLNLTAEEADYLWEMIQVEVGKEGVWEHGYAETVESLHTKIRRIAVERSSNASKEVDDAR